MGAHTRWSFSSEVRWFKFRHPLVWRRAVRENRLEGKIYDAIAETLRVLEIPDERGESYADEPSYDLMVAVMHVLRQEKVRV